MSSSIGLPLGTRRLLVALVLATCLALAGGSVASAQDDVQTLPDPNATPAPNNDGAGSGESGGSGGSPGNGEQAAGALPETGLSALLPITAGLTLLAAGIAVWPIARRRRRYRADTWVAMVRAGSGPSGR